MDIEVLISTMNINSKKQYEKLIDKMNIKGSSIVINQCPNSEVLVHDISNGKNKLFSYREKGLSRSRNLALNKCSSSIALLADDDMSYVNNYEQIIKAAYTKYNDADIIAFFVSSDNPNNVKPKLKEGKVSALKTFKIQSVQLSFKVESIKKYNIIFDDRFGAGSSLYMGEENIFLSDCIRSGLKIYSYPIEIARLDNRESTWFKGYDEEYFIIKGACFYRISKFWWLLLCLQFIIRKRKEYKEKISSFRALRKMIEGKGVLK
ncbi:MAG: hypothetical protein IKQ06_03235 [Bacilli bacterium]|nr:hypothetical protein [Bacilli bacterium]MBR6137146.1 hypothetical protein [Bacilli bacterium]